MWLTIRQMHELAVQSIGDVRLSEVVLNFDFKLWFRMLVSNQV